MKRNTIFTAILGLLIGYVGIVVAYLIFKTPALGTAKSVFYYIPPLGAVALVYYLNGRKLEKPRESTLTGMGDGWYLLAAGVILFLVGYLTMDKRGLVTPGPTVIFFYLLSSLVTGVYEELLFRGFGLGVLLDAAEEKGESARKAIFLSALFFALIHLTNLITSPALIIGTLGQVGYTLMMGLLLGAVYYKTRNILSVILLHGLFNFVGSFTELYLPLGTGAPTQDISLLSVAIQWVVMAPTIYFGKKIRKEA